MVFLSSGQKIFQICFRDLLLILFRQLPVTIVAIDLVAMGMESIFIYLLSIIVPIIRFLFAQAVFWYPLDYRR